MITEKELLNAIDLESDEQLHVIMGINPSDGLALTQLKEMLNKLYDEGLIYRTRSTLAGDRSRGLTPAGKQHLQDIKHPLCAWLWKNRLQLGIAGASIGAVIVVAAFL